MGLLDRVRDFRRADAPRPWYEEQRAFPRWPVALEGSCYGTWGSSRCLITELAEGGVSIVCGHEARLGEELTVAWRLAPIETPLQVTCVVRYISDRQIGLQFLDATRADHIRIRHFLRQHLRTENA